MYVYRINFVFNVTLMCVMSFYLSRVSTTTFIFVNVYYSYFNLSELNAFCCLVFGYGHIISIMGLSSLCIMSAILIFIKLMKTRFTSVNFFHLSFHPEKYITKSCKQQTHFDCTLTCAFDIGHY